MNKYFFVLTLVSVAALVAGGCVSKNKEVSKSQTPSGRQDTSNQVSSSTTERVDTSQWKIYVNKEARFQLSLPQEWGAPNHTFVEGVPHPEYDGDRRFEFLQNYQKVTWSLVKNDAIVAISIASKNVTSTVSLDEINSFIGGEFDSANRIELNGNPALAVISYSISRYKDGRSVQRNILMKSDDVVYLVDISIDSVNSELTERMYKNAISAFQTFVPIAN